MITVHHKSVCESAVTNGWYWKLRASIANESNASNVTCEGHTRTKREALEAIRRARHWMSQAFGGKR